MRRRIFLKGSAAAAGGVFASVLGIDHRTAGAQEVEPSVADAELTVRDVSCGDGSQRATVRSDPAADRVTVDGVAAAPSACYTAELADATYDGDADALHLDVRTVEREDVGVCAQCLTAIEYRVVVAFDGGLPARAVVRHDEETVTETALGERGASWRQSAFDAANTAVDPAGRGPGGDPATAWAQDGVGTAPAIVDAAAETGDAGGSGDDAGGSGNGDSDGTGGTATAYVGAPGGGIRALDAETGSERWSFDAVGPLVGAPAVVGGTAYAGNIDGQLAAVDAVTGDPAWTRSIDGVVAGGPTVTVDSEADDAASPAPNAVYVAARGPGESGRVHAVDPADGTVRWTRDVGGSIGVSPAATNDRVYAARTDGTLLALSPEDGRREWELTGADEAVHVSAPAVRDGTAYLAARTESDDGPAGRVFAVDAASGEREWTADLGASAVPRSLAVADGTVVAGVATYGNVALADETDDADAGGEPTRDTAGENETDAVDDSGTDGDQSANETGDPTGSGGDGAAAGAEGASGTEGRIYALDAGDGEERWRRTATAAVTAGPTVAGETAYVPLDGGVAALALEDGAERWMRSFPARVTARATPANGRLYVAVEGDRLAALAANESEGGADGAVTR